MDNIRFALLIAAAALCFFLYQAWQTDYPAPPSAQTAKNNANPRGQNHGLNSNRPPADETDVPSLDTAPSDNTRRADNATRGGQGNAGIARQGEKKNNSPVAGKQGPQIHVTTDKLNVVIDTRGGSLAQVALRGVPVSDAQPNTDLRLINNTLPNFFVEQSGLVATAGKAPNHHTLYQAVKKNYRLAKGQKTLEVPLTWTDHSGHKVTMVYTFHRGSYQIGLDHRISNQSRTPWTLAQYVRFWRTPHEAAGDVPFSHAFFGVGWYQAKNNGKSFSYQTEGHDDISQNPLALSQSGGWIAMVQHYFIGAVIPPAHSQAHFFARPKNVSGASGGYATGFVGAQQTVRPGATRDFTSDLFVGPKYQDQLSAVAPGLGLTVDYGWFTVLAKPIFKVLDFLHSIVGNWGLAIILLTCLIKLVFYKLSEIQYRGMARMRKFQPRMAQLKEQYGDDKQQLQAKMMELYKKEGFNPLAGCWPLLVQMPVFISLYWVLRESVELRHAPFMLWIQDLSAPDPYYILPVVFGATMFLQQRLNANVTMDPMQQRMMQIMPVGMAIFFAFFPAGLVLYWCTNNLLSMAQQWWIYRKLDAEELGRKAKA